MTGRSTIPRELDELQRWFLRVITHPESPHAGLSAADRLQPSAAGAIQPNARLSAEAQLEIYHNAYHSRLTDCLADDYPALRHALGAATFEALCRDYIAQFPSRSPSLNRFGAHMPAFCAQWDLPQAACAAELAQLEWAIVEVIHAAQGQAISGAALATLTEAGFGEVRFEPSPALRLLEQYHDVNTYYASFRQHVAAGEPAPPTSPQPWAAERHGFTLVRRRGATVTREVLEPQRAVLLQALLAQQPVAAALDLAAHSGMTAESVSAAFEHFLAQGCFVAIRA
ncbi:MAG: DNA-binding domain-containing protein [Polyangiales bacterium]